MTQREFRKKSMIILGLSVFLLACMNFIYTVASNELISARQALRDEIISA